MNEQLNLHTLCKCDINLVLYMNYIDAVFWSLLDDSLIFEVEQIIRYLLLSKFKTGQKNSMQHWNTSPFFLHDDEQSLGIV